MKLFNYSLLVVLLFIKCSGMESFFDKSAQTDSFKNPNPYITEILSQLKKEIAERTLNAEKFWTLMAKSTGMGSCFLGEFIASSYEKDVCLVFEYLIQFGQEDKNKFYECIIGCTGIVGITPLNELIRYIPSETSSLFQLFIKILNLIKTLDIMQKTDVLNQKDMYGSSPIETAQLENKPYITNAITLILLSDTGAAQWAYECGFDDTQIQKTKSQL